MTSIAGLISKPSQYSFAETVSSLEKTLESNGVKIFAVVDHSGEAAKAGMAMSPAKLLIFGNPKAGTPLMIAAPSVAIDLPLKILISEDSAGKVWLSFNAPEYLQQRHGIPADLMKNISVAGALIDQALA
ncbi:MAG: DUF302 domain-containing protein [Candidatus Binataceae bacterium]